jgi:hypothetical protein
VPRRHLLLLPAPASTPTKLCSPRHRHSNLLLLLLRRSLSALCPLCPLFFCPTCTASLLPLAPFRRAHL